MPYKRNKTPQENNGLGRGVSVNCASSHHFVIGYFPRTAQHCVYAKKKNKFIAISQDIYYTRSSETQNRMRNVFTRLARERTERTFF